ncbi:Lpg1974 family pore-forming outer membrane protein [Hyphomicrobium sp.]|uniref:Lpg1974 family pore-forming outer membrane protein n=1 Tax=Hyphomicrobium sp. TaxID=82 RepID=UPI002FE2E1C2
MAFDRRRISHFAPGWRWLALGVAMLASPTPGGAETASPLPGLTIEVEGQRVFGASDFEAGLIPDLGLGALRTLKLDDGNGWGGAIAIGYGWRNGWSGTVRYRRLEADRSGDPISDGVIAFAAADPLLPGGFLVGLAEARTEVRSDMSRVDLEIASDVAFMGARGQIFGGVTYAAINRETAIVDTCSCAPRLLRLSSTFQGAGPKIGVRGAVPLGAAVRLVGGASVAALIGRSEFESASIDPLAPQGTFKDEDTRVAAALDGEAGLAFALDAGTLTVGYRADALIGALDTDQRVSEPFRALGLPAIGDTRDDIIAHGPFVRFAMPLAGTGN